MKRGLLLLLTVCFVVSGVPKRVNAAALTYEDSEELKQEELERIFEEINQLALEKLNADVLEALGISEDFQQMAEKQNQISEREKELDELLAALGVKKIDPENENDMAMLYELSEGSAVSDPQGARSNPIDTAPDFSAIARRL